ncbi:hypothetical protein [Nocardia colli]|uniref:hypothetical protein n=1 Tax=Nocardia colli TaxID=2545717 RepID=UPI0035E097E7
MLTAEEVKEIDDGSGIDVEAILASDWSSSAARGANGKPVEFRLYSMRQAIEEGDILDVLRGYQTYDTALEIAEKAEGGDYSEVYEPPWTPRTPTAPLVAFSGSVTMAEDEEWDKKLSGVTAVQTLSRLNRTAGLNTLDLFRRTSRPKSGSTTS